MPKTKLTHQQIKGIDPPEKRVTYYDTKETGLILRVTPGGSKTFCYRYRFRGKKRRFTIGKFPAVSLSQARDRTRKLKVKVGDGIDPQAEKNKRRYQPDKRTFAELAELFSKRHLSELRERTRQEWQRIIDVELLKKHKWGELDVADITAQHVRELLNHKAYDEDAPVMANRIREVISRMFSFGIKKIGLEIDKNPVEATAPFDEGGPRERHYSEEELKELWEYWETVPEPLGSYYKFLLITGQRKTETMRMRWDHIEYDKPHKKIKIGPNGKPSPEAFLADVWTIPADLAKSGRSHKVPLSELALEILEHLKSITGESEYVFESPVNDGRPLTTVKSTTAKIKRETGVSDFQLHDLRRTVITGMEEMAIDRSIVGKVVNHKEMAGDHSITAKYSWYDYMDRKQEALQQWSWRLRGILSGQAETKIHKLGG